MELSYSHKTVGGIVAERPSTSRVFERYGIDYCCGGKRPLHEACAEKAIDLDAVLCELDCEAVSTDAGQIQWAEAPLSQLVTHIVDTHHAYLREALPRLSFLTAKVRDAHGSRHPELAELVEVFTAFREEMESHALKEERILFPYIEQLEQAETLPVFHCGSVQNPIRQMEKEHDEAGAALETMRALTNGYTPPQGACNTYRAMLHALAELEGDMHRHVHKENSILFPRAEAREAELAARVPAAAVKGEK